MRRYHFALQPVLRVREVEQDNARAAFLSAQQDLLAAEEQRRRTADRYETLAAETSAEGASSWLAHRMMADHSAASVRSAEAGREAARLAVDDRRSALRAARTRTSALERLDERRREDHRLEQRRAEDADADELVVTRHGRQR